MDFEFYSLSAVSPQWLIKCHKEGTIVSPTAFKFKTVHEECSELRVQLEETKVQLAAAKQTIASLQSQVGEQPARKTMKADEIVALSCIKDTKAFRAAFKERFPYFAPLDCKEWAKQQIERVKQDAKLLPYVYTQEGRRDVNVRALHDGPRSSSTKANRFIYKDAPTNVTMPLLCYDAIALADGNSGCKTYIAHLVEQSTYVDRELVSQDTATNRGRDWNAAIFYGLSKLQEKKLVLFEHSSKIWRTNEPLPSGHYNSNTSSKTTQTYFELV